MPLPLHGRLDAVGETKRFGPTALATTFEVYAACSRTSSAGFVGDLRLRFSLAHLHFRTDV